MIRKIKRNIARRNMKAEGLRRIHKADKHHPEWKSYFALNWRKYLKKRILKRSASKRRNT